MADFKHADLCEIAGRWLKRPFSALGHGCQIAFTETRTSFLAGEIPDAVGFRVSSRSYGAGSTVVECKVSRSDFFHDKKKPHRIEGFGMGRFRYFMFPENLVTLSEVPEGWGLLYVTPKMTVSVIAGATLSIHLPGIYDLPHDAFSETLLLANLLARVGNADRLNMRLRIADRLNAQLQRRNEAIEKRLSDIEAKYYALKYPDIQKADVRWTTV